VAPPLIITYKPSIPSPPPNPPVADPVATNVNVPLFMVNVFAAFIAFAME
jgi:hypothetical protein